MTKAIHLLGLTASLAFLFSSCANQSGSAGTGVSATGTSTSRASGFGTGAIGAGGFGHASDVSSGGVGLQRGASAGAGGR